MVFDDNSSSNDGKNRGNGNFSISYDIFRSDKRIDFKIPVFVALLTSEERKYALILIIFQFVEEDDLHNSWNVCRVIFICSYLQ